MLRDYHYTENWRLLDAALEQFIDLPSSLKLVQYITLSPDSFLWKISDGEKMYYLYAEDFVEGLNGVRASVESHTPEGARLTFLPVKNPVAFEDSTPNQSAVVYRPPENEYEVATFAGQSGHDFVFLLESDESVAGTPSDNAKFKEITYDHEPGPLRIARDILQLAETASLNGDVSNIFAVQGVLMSLEYMDAKDETVDLALLQKYVDVLENELLGEIKKESPKKQQLHEQIYAKLSERNQADINAKKYAAEHLPETVVLVTAMYAKRDAGATNGTSIAILVDGSTIEYPMQHFLDDKLREYFKDNPHINDLNIHQLMPERLGDYVLVEGSEDARRVFRRELGYINW